MLCLVEIYDFFDFLLFIGAMTSYLVQNGQISRGSGKFSKEDYQTIISWKFQPIVKMRSGSFIFGAKYFHYKDDPGFYSFRKFQVIAEISHFSPRRFLFIILYRWNLKFDFLRILKIQLFSYSS